VEWHSFSLAETVDWHGFAVPKRWKGTASAVPKRRLWIRALAPAAAA